MEDRKDESVHALELINKGWGACDRMIVEVTRDGGWRVAMWDGAAKVAEMEFAPMDGVAVRGWLSKYLDKYTVYGRDS